MNFALVVAKVGLPSNLAWLFTIGGTMRKKQHKNPVISQFRTVETRPFEESKVEMIQRFENVASAGQIETSIEDALNEVFPPEYGGSE
jgi:hypothetical protein